MGFADSVGKTADKMKQQVNDKIVEISQELFAAITIRTPVGTWSTRGRLINNWYVGTGKGQYNRSYSLVSNTSGASSYAQITSLKGSTEFVGKDGEVSYTNSTPYGYRAEYFGWNYSAKESKWRGTKPYAMVANGLAVTAAKYKGGK